MSLGRIVEYSFFFSLLVLSGYMVWLITAPFLSALALAAVIVTISNPLNAWLVPRMPYRNRSLAALLSTVIVFVVGILPLLVMASLIINEGATFYKSVEESGYLADGIVATVERQVELLLPGVELNLADQVTRGVQWFTGNLGQIFAGTISTFFLFFIALIGSFYFFRDGRELLHVVVKVSPLPDEEDQEILNRLGQAVRAVATGTLLVAIIQGMLATIGLAMFGVSNAILLGCLVAIAAMIPGVGTGVVMLPIVAVLFFSGDVVNAIGLLLWALTAVGLVDNLLGPYLTGRGNNMHPFIILISVLGGIALFGPVGFLIGPVVVTLFLVLLEIYNQYILTDQRIDADA